MLSNFGQTSAAHHQRSLVAKYEIIETNRWDFPVAQIAYSKAIFISESFHLKGHLNMACGKNGIIVWFSIMMVCCSESEIWSWLLTFEALKISLDSGRNQTNAMRAIRLRLYKNSKKVLFSFLEASRQSCAMLFDTVT